MSEELIQKNLLKNGQAISNYEYYNIGNTNINSLANYRIIPNKNYGVYKDKRPDGLIVDRRNKSDIKVIAVLEFKGINEFNSKRKKKEATEQCNTYCEILGANYGIVTDGSTYIWINPQIKTENAGYKYIDDEDIERGYDVVTDDKGNKLTESVDFTNLDGIKKYLDLDNKLEASLDEEFSQLRIENNKNPKLLAKQVWQSVWLATGDDPKKCLMTFIELFIFKYLSDLNVLTKNNNGVDIDFETVLNRGKDYCLKYYMNNVRGYIKTKFPASTIDETTIINGLSLRDNQNQDELFYSILSNFKKFGDLKNVDPEFKSRLFEEFLKGTTGKKQLAQFFTPRNVVKAIVEMAKVENLPDNAKVCDPASGVGGFILESMIYRSQKNKNDFYFEQNNLKKTIQYYGYDLDESTIILAKANILIFLSELLQKNTGLTEEFAKLFNEVFLACSDSIIGSLEKTNEEKYDLVMSNPPYVSKGLALYKNYINNSDLKQFYKIQSQGKEGLFIEKIVRELKPSGKAFIVVPDGFLYRPIDSELKQFIKDNCIIDGIISLPEKTFYTTDKKTYIIALTKKEKDSNIPQTEPVFTYLVSNIGESLDTYRVKTNENNLEDMVTQFNYFLSNKVGFAPLNNRCKIQDISMFNAENKWLVDEWWTFEEKVLLGVEVEKSEFTNDILFKKFTDIKSNIVELEEKLPEYFTEEHEAQQYYTTTFGNEELFEIRSSLLNFNRRDYSTLDRGVGNGIPIFTARIEPVAYIEQLSKVSPYVASEEEPNISIANDGDGSAGRNVVFHTKNYYLNTSRVAIKVLDKKVNPKYVFYYIHDLKRRYGFNFKHKLYVNVLKNIDIKIPIDKDGNFDLVKQQEFIEDYERMQEIDEEIRSKLFNELKQLEGNITEYLLDSFKNNRNI